MKKINYSAAILLSTAASIFLFGACGQNENLSDTQANEKSMGQTETFLNDEVKNAMPTQMMNEELIPGSEVATTDDLTSSLESVDAPLAEDALALDVPVDGYYSFPYYCNPAKYPFHIIKSIAACSDALRVWGTSYGYYKYLPRLYNHYGPYYGGRYPGYRVRNKVGNISGRRYWGDDDDDDDNRRKRRKRRR